MGRSREDVENVKATLSNNFRRRTMSTARSHNVQLQSEASDEDGDSGGEVEEWRRYPHSSEKGKSQSVCPEVDKRIWGG